VLDVTAGRRRGLLWFSLLGGLVGLFAGYYRMALTVPTTADGAGNALQAFDLIHRNPWLHGWTVSDVSFYGVELFQFAAIERVIGLSPRVAPASAALSYALIVLLVGLLAKGRSTGILAWLRVGLAVSIVLVPAPGVGQAVLLSGPDHTGAAVPLLLAWLLLDRAGRNQRRWLPYAVAAVLAWGQLADPVLSLVGAAPLVLVCLARTIRRRAWRGPDAALALAGAVSVLVAYGAVRLIGQLGGYRTQAVPTDLVSWRQLGSQLRTAAESLTVLFGCHFPELHGWFERSLGVLHLLGLGLVVLAVARTVQLAWRGIGDRIDQVIVAGIVINLAAFVWSALNINLLASHEIVPVLPLSAVLVARVLISSEGVRPVWLAGWLATGARILALGLAGLLVVGFVGNAGRPAVRPSGTAVADWLAARQLSYGLGGYWVANSISVDSGGAVRVVPLNGISHVTGYRWESRQDWYDPAKHDARFIVLQLNSPSFFTANVAIAQFGQPVDRVTLPTSDQGNATVLVYDRNLLVGLPAWCAPGQEAPSMAEC
jgi:hypothetical protein